MLLISAHFEKPRTKQVEAMMALIGELHRRSGSVVEAVRCGIEIQNSMIERNAGLPPERRIEFRIGIHLGDLVEE
jgi:class 3 adenylate cyclase